MLIISVPVGVALLAFFTPFSFLFLFSYFSIIIITDRMF